MRFHARRTPLRVSECPTCLQGDALVTGEWWSDPNPLLARDFMMSGDVVAWGLGEVPQAVSYQLDCGHWVDAQVWVPELIGDSHRGFAYHRWKRDIE